MQLRIPGQETPFWPEDRWPGTQSGPQSTGHYQATRTEGLNSASALCPDQCGTHNTQQTGQVWQGRGVPPTSWSIPSSNGPERESDPCLSGSRPWLPSHSLPFPGAARPSRCAGEAQRSGGETPWRPRDQGQSRAAGRGAGGNAESCSHRGWGTAYSPSFVITLQPGMSVRDAQLVLGPSSPSLPSTHGRHPPCGSIQATQPPQAA